MPSSAIFAANRAMADDGFASSALDSTKAEHLQGATKMRFKDQVVVIIRLGHRFSGLV